MSRGAVLDIEGRECSEEEAAKGCGFVNVEAYREWSRRRYQEFDLLPEICNLKQQVKILEERLNALTNHPIGPIKEPPHYSSLTEEQKQQIEQMVKEFQEWYKKASLEKTNV